MAEDHTQRYRSSESIARTGQPRAGAPAGSGPANDPLAELARLIGQTDPFSDAPPRRAESAPAAGVEWSAPAAQPRAQQAFAAADFQVAPRHSPPAGPGEPYYANQSWTQPFEAPAQGEGLYQVEQEIPSYLTERGAGGAPPHETYASADEQFGPEHEEYYDEPPPRRRMAVMAVAAVFGLAVLGTAGAFGYRTLFGSGSHVPPVIQADKSPLKVVPDNAGSQGKAIADRVTNPGEKLLPREEKPVDITQLVQASAPPQASAGNGLVAGEPKKVQTIVIRPDGSSGQPVAMASPMPPEAAAPQAAPPLAPAARPKADRDSGPRAAQAAAPVPEPPLSLSPDQAPASRPVRTANAAPVATAPAAGQAHVTAYAVQIASQKTEADAKAAYQAIAKKYPQVLEGKSMFVYSVELGAKGTYYRAMVGPYSVASEANGVCSALKSAGGSCLIQRNP